MTGETLTMQAGRSDPDLLNRLRDGCAETSQNFVREHAPWMLSVARRILRDDSAAEDVVQEAFDRAFQGLQNFEGRSALKT